MKRSFKPHLIQLAIALPAGYLLEKYLTLLLWLGSEWLNIIWEFLGSGATEWSIWKILVYAFFGFVAGMVLLGMPFALLYNIIKERYRKVIQRKFYKRFQGLDAAEKAFMSGRAWRPGTGLTFGTVGTFNPFDPEAGEVNPYKAGVIENEVVQTDLETEWEKGKAFTITEQYYLGSVILTIVFTIVVALLIFSVESYLISDWVWLGVAVFLIIVILALTARGLYNPATGEALFYKKWLDPSNYYKFMRNRNPYEERTDKKQDD